MTTTTNNRSSNQAAAAADKTKSIPGGIGYIFDIIVVHLDITDKDAKHVVDKDPSTLMVQATFNKEELQITSSRINVVEFKAGKSYEFTENPSTLRDDLSKNKLKLRIMHAGKELAISAMDWPESFINCLTDPSSIGELTHVFESEIKQCNSGNIIGTIEVIVRLQTKCAEWNDDDGCSKKPEDVSKIANKVIDPNDILFVVGEDKNACSCAQVGLIPASDSDKSLNATCLDLSSFRAVHGKTVPNADILSCVDPACDELENVTKQYQQLIDSLTKKNQKPSPSPCCSKQQEKPITCAQPAPRPQTQNCSGPMDLCSGSSSGIQCRNCPKCGNPKSCKRQTYTQIPPCCCCSDEGAFAGENVVNFCHKDSLPKLTEQVPVQHRCCPLCKENLKWLPKLAACPKCGYKPIPQCDEKPYDDQATAEQILHDFLERKNSCTTQLSDQMCPTPDDGKKQCRCTCKPKKICAYCRIKQLCADVLQSTKTEECGKCETKSSSEQYNVCNTSSKDCRPYLSRVFSELKDVYDIRETKEKGLEVDQRCENILNAGDGEANKRCKEKSKKISKSKTKLEEDELERKEFLTKNFGKSHDVCKSKQTYNYGAVRKYPGTKVGHKTCINGFAGRKNVPSNMGWLWNVEATGLRAGWKPGAIRKPIKELMKYFLKDFPADTLRVSQYSYRRSGGDCRDSEEELIQKPTLHICKKNGEYFITLRPLKDTESLRECADPYLNMKPIQFKITKNPLLTEMRKMKQCLKEMGFSKCTCHKPILYCFCRSFLDKKRLEYQCNKEARKRNLPPCCDSLVLSDTTDSDTEFDFGVTPPAGVIKPERLKRPNFVNTGTQYVENDWNVPPLYPKEPNKYMKLYNCAVGERFGREFGPYGVDGYGPGVTASAGVYAACGRGGGSGGGGGFGGGAAGGGGGRGGKGGKGGAWGAVGGRGGGKGFGGGKGGAGGDGGKKGGNVDMMRYLSKSKGPKLTPAEMAEKRKKRLRELSGVAPPILCMVDRRGKPYDPCAPLPMSCCGDPYARDNRIC